MADSLERQLAAALSPSEAPPELWDRIAATIDLAPSPRQRTPWRNFVMAAAAAALLTGGAIYLRAFNSQPSFGSVAMASHRGASLASPYAVQRYEHAGLAVTVLSKPDADFAGPKRVLTVEQGELAISEWSLDGRRWAMVSAAASHRRACAVCHRA